MPWPGRYTPISSSPGATSVKAQRVTPAVQGGAIRQLAAQAADFIEAGIDQPFAADVAVVLQLQGERALRLEGLLGPQGGVVDAETEPAQFTATEADGGRQLVAPVAGSGGGVKWALIRLVHSISKVYSTAYSAAYSAA
jgi:hypothetical protein